MPPAVSIILPTYDRLVYLKEAVHSVLAQTVADWELIVVDDGSTDDTVAWLESLGDPRVIALRQEHTGNRSRVRNVGVAHAHAERIAFLDSDDLWLSDKLALQLRALADHPTRRWSCTGVRFIDGDGARAFQRAGAPYVAQSGWILEQMLMFTATATMPTLMMEKALFEEVGGFDETFLLREDYELELRLAARSEIHALPDALTAVRHHGGRTSSSKRVADLHRGTVMVFQKVALTTSSKTVRSICRRQSAAQLAQRARVLSRDGEHGAALSSVAEAIRETPFTGSVWRSAIGCALRALARRARR